MNIELSAEQAAAFEAGEPITIVKPKPEPVRKTYLVYDPHAGSIALVRQKDGVTCKTRLLRAWGGDEPFDSEWTAPWATDAFRDERFVWVEFDQ